MEDRTAESMTADVESNVAWSRDGDESEYMSIELHRKDGILNKDLYLIMQTLSTPLRCSSLDQVDFSPLMYAIEISLK